MYQQQHFRFLQHFPLEARERTARECEARQDFISSSGLPGRHGVWRAPNGDCPLARLLSHVGLHKTGSPGADALSLWIYDYFHSQGLRLTQEDRWRIRDEVVLFTRDVDMGYMPDLHAVMTQTAPPPAPRVATRYHILDEAAAVAANALAHTPELPVEPLAAPDDILVKILAAPELLAEYALP